MSHTQKNQQVARIQSKPTWSLSQKLSGLIHLHNSTCQKVDDDHGCIHNLDLGWRCSPPAASVSLQKVGSVIRYSFVTHHGIVEIKVANGLVKNRKLKPKYSFKTNRIEILLLISSKPTMWSPRHHNHLMYLWALSKKKKERRKIGCEQWFQCQYKAKKTKIKGWT